MDEAEVDAMKLMIWEILFALIAKKQLDEINELSKAIIKSTVFVCVDIYIKSP